MSTKAIDIRVQNRFDTLSKWEDASAITLLKGELAIVSIDTDVTATDGSSQTITTHLMKIGDGNQSFSSLPWLSATAYDVYAWAKEQDPSTVKIKYSEATDGSPAWKEISLADLFKKVNNEEAILADIQQAIVSFYNEIDVSGTDGVVKNISVDAANAHTLKVTRSAVETADIADNAITSEKLVDSAVVTNKLEDYAVTTIKIADDAVSNEKIKDVQANKVNVTDDETLLDRLDIIGEQLSYINTALTGRTRFIGIANSIPNTNNITIKISETETKEHQAVEGDIVVYEEKEYLYIAQTFVGADGSSSVSGAWIELGDLSRVSALETLVGSVHSYERTNNRFVTHLSKGLDGKLSVETARPLASDVLVSSGETVETVIADQTAKLSRINSNYVKFNEGSTINNEGNLVVVENGSEYTVIFDCGNADNL